MEDESVVLLTDSFGKVHKVFRIPTPQLSERTQKDLVEVAARFGQRIEFHTVTRWGIEAVKWDIRELNGDT